MPDLPGVPRLAVKGADDGRPVAVFDLDGTLLRGDSFSRFGRQLVFRGSFRTAATLLCAPLLGPLLLLPPTRRLAAAGFLWLATAGVSTEHFTTLAERFAEGHAGEAAGNRIAVTLERLRAHLSAGDRVVIATASAEALAIAICQELGLGGVEIVAAELCPGRSGMRPVRGCRGAEKVHRLRAVGIRTPVEYAYTDSAVDIPLLMAARNRYLVAPTPGHRRVIVDKVGDCTVLE
ncbi:haloacid dehalogenase-like hydrolase [Rugosimonospora africana]|uniref:Phosphoserine phosphatase n=1 Tax=Rugosimonospora africana TaxID=556532 RepID=A0A8J3QWS2_9ACTN|nr:haloacid dehalogenase-like hydrolase [Rugosimonospora africana]GIH17522.1 phosphoserine phosphatase [Rugosimonospora africana]